MAVKEVFQRFGRGRSDVVCTQVWIWSVRMGAGRLSCVIRLMG
jgi:hypothetical protein